VGGSRLATSRGHRATPGRCPVLPGRARGTTGRTSRTAVAALLCAALTATPGEEAHAQAPAIRHSPPPRVEAWQPFALEAVLVGDVSPERVATADVVVATADGGLRSIPLTLSRNSLFGEIPGALVAPPELSYYLRVVDADGMVISAPPGAPESRLFVLAVTGGPDAGLSGARTGSEPAGGSTGTTGPDWVSASVEVLSPLAGEVVVERTPQIAAVFDPPLDEPWDALVVLDGADVTQASSITSGLFVLSPPEPLGNGAHRVTFSAVTATGPVEASWVFFVIERADDGISEDRQPARAPAGDAEPSVDGWGAPGTGWGAPDEAWQVSGRLEAGWVVVAAETTAVESTDIFLPYPEVSRPSVDFYLSGVRGSGTFLITARQDPVYSDDIEWLVSGKAGRFEADVGQIFPSLSRSTLDWAVGQGARVSAKAGRSTTELLGMRVTESDTLAGFGIYSRFAAGGKQSFDWSERLSASVVYLSVFDREGSVPDEQKLSEPLRNSVVAGLVRAGRGALTGEAELARSEASGETEGSGTAFRAKLRFERDWHNRVSIEYVSSEPGFYSAGSYEYDPGEHALELDYSYRPDPRFSSSGWVRAGRSFDSESSLAQDEFELKAYSRAEFSWPLGAGDARTYAVVRYDRVPYETYNYRYAYGAIGGTWSRGGTRLSASVSRSIAHSPDEASTWSAYGDLRRELIRNRWTARAAARWSAGAGSDRTDYTRVHYTLETRWDFGRADLTVEYWLIDREDRADPLQSYAEHVIRVSIGQDL
jgi:hypothetical protein